MSIVSKTCHHQAILEAAMLRGGRLGKFKGRVVSYAPVMGLALAVMATGASSGQAFASTCGDGNTVASGGNCNLNLNGYNPVDNDGRVGATVVDGGNTVVLVGSGSDIVRGDSALRSNTLGALDPSANGVERLLLGSQTQGVSTPDPITGTNIVVATYNSSNLTTSDWGQISNSSTNTVVDVGDNQYYDARLGTVTDGTLQVNIGDATLAPSAAGNAISMAAKQTTLTYAQGAGSTIEWASRNAIGLADVGSAAAGTTTRTVAMTVPVYAGTFTGFDGASHTVSNATELEVYNQLLIGALQTGALSSQAGYDGAFAQAVSFTTQDATFSITVDAGDDTTLPVGADYSMLIDGAGATGIIRSGAQIDQRYAGVAAVNGGHVEIENGGELSGHFTSLSIGSGSTATNNGVISGGYWAGNNFDTTTPGTYVEAQTVVVNGAGSSFDNHGIVNVAGWTYDNLTPVSQYGVLLGNGATASNDGIINVGVNNNSASGTISGVIVNGGSTFTNAASGTIYIGRAAQYDVNAPEAVADTANAVAQYGIVVNSGTATNEGAIVIGAKTQNATAMQMNGGDATTSLINNGTIAVNGAAGGAPLLNNAMRIVNSAGTVANNGVITLSGVNGVGLRALGTTTATTITNNGTINVEGGADPVSGTRNFGVWVEGAQATAQLVGGSVNLSGIGAIGVHARDGAAVIIAPGAGVNFLSGTDQIGYFTYGAGTTIANSAGALDVSTERSTLFRVENGASFLGTGNDLTASGKNTTIVNGTGLGTVVDTADANLSLTGDGATAVRIDGGATGVIRAVTTVTLGAPNTVAGLVDGRKINLAGVASAETYPSLLTNEARIDSSADNAVGFITQFGGKLVNEGVINLSSGVGNTGVIARSGGILTNNADITVANGTGVLVEGAGSASQLSNTATVTVNNGIAGIHIRDGAYLTADNSTGSIVTNGTAHGVLVGTGAAGARLGANTITVNGTGNGIENAAEVSAIGFVGTTINVGNGAGIRTGTAIDPAGAVTINVAGSGDGFAFRYADGGVTANNLLLGSGYVINAKGAGATGIRLNTTGVVDTSANVTVTNAAGGSALFGGPASEIVNRGSLVSASTAAPTVDLTGGVLTFVNTGTITAPAGGTAILGGDHSQAVIQAGGAITGLIDLGGGDDQYSQLAGTVTGPVVGGLGNDTLTLAGGTFTGDIYGDAPTASAADGNDAFIWSGGTWQGAFRGGNGSDTATITAAGYDGSQILDGGDDASSADGWIDELTLSGIKATVNAGKIVNWEVVSLVNSDVTLNDLVTETVKTCGGSTTLGGASVVTDVLGCVSNDSITVTGTTVVAGSIEGAGGADTINVLGDASVGAVHGGGAGQDASAALDGGDTITIATTKTVGAVFGDLGNDTIALNAGTIGSVSGGDGNDAIALAGATVTGTLAGDAGNDLIVLTAGSAATIDGGTGDDVVNWNGLATVATITMGDGSDTLNVNSPAVVLTGVTLAGGGNVAVGDGEIDTLNLNAAWSGKLTGAKTTGWEAININGGTVGIADAAITAGTIAVNAGGTLDGSNNLVATANLAVSAGSKLIAGNAAGTNAMKVTGDLTNNGTVDLRGPAGQQATGDRLTVGGNYAGGAGSTLVLDAKLGNDSSPTDRLIVGGNTTGTSGLMVNNVGGTGALTLGDGIKVVQVDGTSGPTSFALVGGTIDVGAFRYAAYNGGVANPNDQDWYLRSRVRDIVTPTVALARVTQDLSLSTLGTLHERVGEQEHLGLQSSGQNGAFRGMWGRLIGQSYSDTAKSAEFGNARANGQFGGTQMGVDLYRGAGEGGSRTLVGVYGAHLWSDTREYQVTPQARYAGTTSSKGWAAGLYATHYAATGWYIDAVVQGSWLNHKADATDGTTLRTKSTSWLGSLEVGKPIDLGSSFKLEPQVQLIYGSTGLDDTRDSTGILNTYDVEDSLTGRLGFRLKRTWDYDKSSEGGLFTAYLKANVWGTLAGGDTGLTVGVSSQGVVQHRAVWGDVGFGTTFSLSPNAEFFADADVEFGLDQGATALTGHTGLRVRF